MRLMHTALCACGLKTRSRITGVIPRELSCKGMRAIRRDSPVHISEMKWWLEQIPEDTKAVVAENSAVSPELQPFPAEILSPTLIILTNCRADHEEVWGKGEGNAARAIFAGIPDDVQLIANQIPNMTRDKIIYTSQNSSLNSFLSSETQLDFHKAENIRLAATACSFLNIPLEKAIPAMIELKPDIADFRIMQIESSLLAFAFSANETASTEALFASTGWSPGETVLIYHHRLDRGARLSSFIPWIESKQWKDIIFTRNKKPLFDLFGKTKWNDGIKCAADFKDWCKTMSNAKIFGCGNAAGYPIQLGAA